MRIAMIGLVTSGLLGLQACAPPNDAAPAGRPAPDRRELVTSIASVLSMDYAEHINAGLAPLRNYLEHMTSADSIQWMAEDDGLRLLRRAEVVLVGDIHTVDLCRVAFGRLARICAGGEAGQVTLALEAFPVSWGPLLAAVRDRHGPWGRITTGDLLERSWSWPVASLRFVLEDPELAGSKVLACGGEEPVVMPREGTPDWQRHPGELLARRGMEERYWFAAATQNALVTIDQYRRDSRQAGGPVVVLYGIGHLLGEKGLRSALAARGYSVCVCLPFVPELDAAVWGDHAAHAEQDWLVYEEGVVRPPVLTWSEVAAEAVRAAGRKASR